MNGYFDDNATTPLSAEAREAWLLASERRWHNPSGLYREAGAVRRVLEEAREAFGDMLGCEPERVVFNSGATEGANAIMARAARDAADGECVCVSAVEHPCVRAAALKWFGRDRVMEIPVDEGTGSVEVGAVEEAIESGGVALVAVMAANNETGVLQPWSDLAGRCRERGVRFFCDGAQWAGKMPGAGLGVCDWVTVSGHKFGGPKGIGIVVVPGDLPGPLALQAGGPQESGHRGGTENYPAVAAMLAALRAREGIETEAEAEAEAGAGAGALAGCRDGFERDLVERIPGTRLVGDGGERLWNTSMVVMPAHSNLKWLTRLSEKGYAVSTGSACSAGAGHPSAVMTAMGLGHDEMGRVLRFSGGRETAGEDWSGLGEALATVWEDLERGGGRRRAKVDLGRL